MASGNIFVRGAGFAQGIVLRKTHIFSTFRRGALARATLAALAGGFFLIAAAGTGSAAGGDAKVKHLLRAKGCGACHYIPGVSGATGTMGPSLKGLKNRARIAGGKLENTEENLREWLRNPKSIRPETMMPNLGLEDAEIEMLLKFFAKL